MGQMQDRIHNFVEKHIVADDPNPERSWLDKKSGVVDSTAEEIPKIL